MSLRYVYYPSGDTCTTCTEPLTYRSTIEMCDS